MMTTNITHILILLFLLPYTVTGNSQLEKLFFGGRWWASGEGMHHSWGIGSFYIRFRGSSLLKVKIKTGWSDGLFYTCKINDGLDEKLYHQNSEDYMTIAEDLDPSIQYNIWCSRNNEASWGVTTMSSVVLDEGGELLQATDPNSDDSMLRIEFVGDSITAGFKISASSASEPSTTANQDVHLAYPRHLADLFQTSDFQVIARSGISVVDIEATGVPMPLEYKCEEFYWDWQGSCPSLHDFSSWQADVVVVNLGTNDYVYGDPIQPWLFKQTYFSFLRDIRAK